MSEGENAVFFLIWKNAWSCGKVVNLAMTNSSLSLSQLSEFVFYHLFYLGATVMVIERTSIFLFLKHNKNTIEH